MNKQQLINGWLISLILNTGYEGAEVRILRLLLSLKFSGTNLSKKIGPKSHLWVKYLMFLFLSHHSSSSHNLCPKQKSKGILGCSNYWWYKYQALLLYCGVTKKNMLLKLIVNLNIQQARHPWNIIANYIHFICSLHIFHLDKYQFWTYTYTSTLRIKALMILLLHQSIRNLYKFLVNYL